MSPVFRIGKICRLTYWLVAVSLCAGCQYDPEYDTLSAFPSNPERKSLEELDLAAVESHAAEYLPGVNTAPEENIVKPEVINPEPGVKGFLVKSKRTDEGPKKFVRLDSSSTGIEAAVTESLKQENDHLLKTPFSSSGIAVADLSRDGLPDLIVADRVSGVRLYRNQGDFSFREITRFAALQQKDCWGVSPTLVDVNNDGLLDIYLCCYLSPNKLLINKGLKFEERAARYGLDFMGASVAASFADYDRDGDLDLYLVTHAGADDEGTVGQVDRFFRNDGFEFADLTDEQVVPKRSYRGNAAVWLDFNNDDWPDLFVANEAGAPDQLLKNLGADRQGNVKFEDVSGDYLTSMTRDSKGTCICDLNDDGQLDLLVAGNSIPIEAQPLANRRRSFGGGRNTRRKNSGGIPPQNFGSSAYLNFGQAPFLELANAYNLGSCGRTTAFCCSDFDNDGFSDLWLANGAIRNFDDKVLTGELENRKLGSSEADEFWFQQSPLPQVDAVFQKMDRQFVYSSETWGIEQADVCQCVVSADFDGDGDLDVVTRSDVGEITIFKNQIAMGNSITIELRGVQSNSAVAGSRLALKAGDLPEQVKLVSMSGNYLSSQSPTQHFGLGTADTVEELTIRWPTGFVKKYSNLDADYRYEIVEPRPTSSTGFGRIAKSKRHSIKVQKLELGRSVKDSGFDDFRLQPLLPFKYSNVGSGHAWADIDGDGDDDLFVGGQKNISASLLRNTGRLRFSQYKANSVFTTDSRFTDAGAVFVDIDGDRDVDLFVVSGGVDLDANAGVARDRLYLNDGKGRFTKSNNAVEGEQSSGGPVAAADFDKDGLMDIFVGGRMVPGQFPATPRSQLLQMKDGVLLDRVEAIAPGLSEIGMVVGCNWVDIDGDNNLDLIVTCHYGATHCFHNVEGKLIDVTQSSGLATKIGLYNSLCSGDIDNDGDTDLIACNLGTNTSYQATELRPMTLFVVEDGDSETRYLFETHFDRGENFPLRSLDLLSKYIDGIGDQYQSSAEFAETDAEEIFAKSNLNPTQTLTVNSLESGTWINESKPGEIKFRFKPLPPITQSGPLFGCQLVDFNADGILDLYCLADNQGLHPFYDPVVDGQGVLLYGNGLGDFHSPDVNERSVVSDAARSVTVVDVDSDGNCDLVAATLDGNLRFFSSTSYKSRQIDLRKLDPDKNPIGAKVTFYFADGSRRLDQIVSNSGYLSQCPPVVYSGMKTDNKIIRVQIDWPDGTSQSDTIENLRAKK